MNPEAFWLAELFTYPMTKTGLAKRRSIKNFADKFTYPMEISIANSYRGASAFLLAHFS